MSRDYKHRAERRPPKRQLPGWLWLLTGLLLGGFLTGLVWLQGQSTEAGGEWVGARPDRPPQGEPAVGQESVPPPKPRFDFYDLLPKMEVLVPEDELDDAPPPAPVRPVEPPAPAPAGPSYVVQVGSFRRAADADRLKAQLALLGFEAKVAAARINAADTRYRVRTGPYSGKQAAGQARQRLAQNGFSPIVVRVGN